MSSRGRTSIRAGGQLQQVVEVCKKVSEVGEGRKGGNKSRGHRSILAWRNVISGHGYVQQCISLICIVSEQEWSDSLKWFGSLESLEPLLLYDPLSPITKYVKSRKTTKKKLNVQNEHIRFNANIKIRFKYCKKITEIATKMQSVQIGIWTYIFMSGTLTH